MTLRSVSRKVQPLSGSARPFLEKGIEEHDETIMLHVNTKDNENGRRRRDRPLGLSNRKGTNLKVCPYSVVFGGDFRVKHFVFIILCIISLIFLSGGVILAEEL